MKTRPRLLVLLAGALACLLCRTSIAQQTPTSDGTIRIDVNLVQVDAVVTDSKGKAVRDLEASDFEVFQDGQLQTITNFAFINVRDSVVRAAPTPNQPAPKLKKGEAPPPPPPPPGMLRPDQIRRTVAIVVDDLGLSFDSTVRIRESLKKWVDNEMQPGDLVAIIRTSAGMGALQQFTNDKRMLSSAVNLVQYHLGRVGVSSFAPLAGALPEGAIDTSFFEDEVQEAYTLGSIGAIQYVIQGLRDLPGRKSLVLFSENMRLTFFQGENLVNVASQTQSTSEDRLKKLADAAVRSGVVIHAVDPRGVVYTGLTAEDRTTGMSAAQIADAESQRALDFIASQDGMVMLSQKTGGLFVSNNNDIPGALRQVVDDGDGYYLIGYQPDAATFDEKTGRRKFHNISVKVKRPGLSVRSRTGFFGSPEQANPTPTTAVAQLTKALSSPFGSGSLPLRLTTLLSFSDKEGPYINALLYFDPRDLTFTKEADGFRKAAIDILAVTMDVDGQQFNTANRKYEFRVPEDRYQNILKRGLVYTTHVVVRKSGAYQMRVVLRDSNSQQLGTASQFIEVPDVKKGKLALSGIVIAADNSAAKTDAAEGAAAADDPNSTPAVRIFKPGAAIGYAYEILNAKTGRDRKPELNAQVRLFRDGKQVWSSASGSIVGETPKNSKALVAGGRLQFNQITPGTYVLQVIVTDKVAKRIAAQATDFEVRP